VRDFKILMRKMVKQKIVFGWSRKTERDLCIVGEIQ